MEFEKLIRERYSCRKLKDTPIEKEKLVRILEAGIAAPTGCNYQPYKLWVLTGEENCRVMSELTKYTFGAGTFIVVGADPSKAWTRKYDGLNISTIDASIVATHLMLGIHDAGLGSTWVGSFNAPEMKKRYPEMQDQQRNVEPLAKWFLCLQSGQKHRMGFHPVLNKNADLLCKHCSNLHLTYFS